MPKKLYPTDTLQQARSILVAWNLIDPTLKIGMLTHETIESDLATVKALQEKIQELQNELLSLRYERDHGLHRRLGQGQAGAGRDKRHVRR